MRSFFVGGMTMKSKVYNIDIYNILKEYKNKYRHSDCVIDDINELNFIKNIMNRVRDRLKAIEHNYYLSMLDTNRKTKQTLISKRQKACFLNIIRSVDESMFANAIREFMDYIVNYDYEKMNQPIELNQYVMYDIIMNIIEEKIEKNI